MSPHFPRTQAITYCLLVETNQGLLLVDTGFGLQDYLQPQPLMNGFLYLLGVPRREAETAIRQVGHLGYAPKDVTHVVMTHLHLDHSGGLRDFPDAQVHVHQAEHEAAMHPRGLVERAYLQQHWSHGPRWVLHSQPAARWLGFDAIPLVEGLVPQVLLIPLPGHSRGHCGVVVERDGGWIFHAGDAVSPFHRDADPHDLPASLHTADVFPGWLVRRLMGPHVTRLRELVRQHPEVVTLISAHDIYSFNKLART